MLDKAEQEAEEILIQEGFIEPEELEPEVAELLREASRRKRRLIRAFHRLMWMGDPGEE